MMFAYFKCAFHRIAYPEIWHHFFYQYWGAYFTTKAGHLWHVLTNIFKHWQCFCVTYCNISMFLYMPFIFYLYFLHRCVLAVLILIIILCVCYICISSCDFLTTLIVVDLLKVGEVLPLVNIIETDTKMIQIILEYGGTSTNAEIKVVLLRLSW